MYIFINSFKKKKKQSKRGTYIKSKRLINKLFVNVDTQQTTTKNVVETNEESINC